MIAIENHAGGGLSTLLGDAMSPPAPLTGESEWLRA